MTLKFFGRSPEQSVARVLAASELMSQDARARGELERIISGERDDGVKARMLSALADSLGQNSLDEETVKKAVIPSVNSGNEELREAGARLLVASDRGSCVRWLGKAGDAQPVYSPEGRAALLKGLAKYREGNPDARLIAGAASYLKPSLKSPSEEGVFAAHLMRYAGEEAVAPLTEAVKSGRSDGTVATAMTSLSALYDGIPNQEESLPIRELLYARRSALDNWTPPTELAGYASAAKRSIGMFPAIVAGNLSGEDKAARETQLWRIRMGWEGADPTSRDAYGMVFSSTPFLNRREDVIWKVGSEANTTSYSEQETAARIVFELSRGDVSRIEGRDRILNALQQCSNQEAKSYVDRLRR